MFITYQTGIICIKGSLWLKAPMFAQSAEEEEENALSTMNMGLGNGRIF